MLISTNWIRDFVDLHGLDLDALIHRFTLSTAEVEFTAPRREPTRSMTQLPPTGNWSKVIGLGFACIG